jgi:hypothetical protein
VADARAVLAAQRAHVEPLFGSLAKIPLAAMVAWARASATELARDGAKEIAAG